MPVKETDRAKTDTEQTNLMEDRNRSLLRIRFYLRNSHFRNYHNQCSLG